MSLDDLQLANTFIIIITQNLTEEISKLNTLCVIFRKVTNNLKEDFQGFLLKAVMVTQVNFTSCSVE